MYIDYKLYRSVQISLAPVARYCRDRNNGRKVHEFDFILDIVDKFPHGGIILFNFIPFIDDDDAGFASP